MLHHRQKNHIPFTDKFFAPRLRHQVNALGSTTREDEFVRTRRADVLCDSLPSVFVSVGRAPAQCVQSTMNIRIVVFVEISQRLDDSARFLRTGSTIKVNQVMATYLLMQDWEILAESTPVDLARDSFMHPIICYTSAGAPVHSQRTVKR